MQPAPASPPVDLKTFLARVRDIRLLVVGDIMLDHYVYGQAHRISSEAPVPIVAAQRERFVLGGAANVARNLTGLGASCSLAGIIGPDMAGQRILGQLKEQQIGNTCVFASPHTCTIEKMRVIAQGQHIVRVDREELPRHYAMDNFLGELQSHLQQQSYDGILLSDYAKGVINDALLDFLRTTYPNLPLFLDPKPAWPRNLSGMHLLKPNRSEALAMAGMDPHGPFDPQSVVTTLFQRFEPQHLVITLGGEGMILSSAPDHYQHLPTLAREVYDVSGAGDTVIAALALGLATQQGLLNAAHIANRAAGIVIAHAGTYAIHADELLGTPG